MGDMGRDRLDLDDEDRLPWLEAVDDTTGPEGPAPLRILGFVVGGLLILGAVVAGIYHFQKQGGSEGEGRLIAAQEGDYKVRPSKPEAKAFQGEGDASFSASEGGEPTGRIDPARMPEAPVVATPVQPAKPAPAPRPGPTKATVADRTSAAPVVPATASAKAAASGGPSIQLGAYASQSVADDAWNKLTKRFTYLAALPKSVQTADVNGTTFYRLRAVAGSTAQAGELCGRLKVAGENCIVVR